MPPLIDGSTNPVSCQVQPDSDLCPKPAERSFIGPFRFWKRYHDVSEQLSITHIFLFAKKLNLFLFFTD